MDGVLNGVTYNRTTKQATTKRDNNIDKKERNREKERDRTRVYVYMRAGQSIDDGIDRRRERATAIDTGDA